MLDRSKKSFSTRSRHHLAAVCFATLAIFAVSTTGRAQQANDDGADWPMFLRDLAGTRFSPLTEINTENVDELQQSWVYKFNRPGKPITGASPSELYQEITPIVIDGIMYTPSGDRVVALNAATGEEIWVHEMEEGDQASFRGVGYWPGDANNPPRVLYTHGKKLSALNATTGRTDPGFGNEGTIELEVAYDGAPIVFGNTMFIGTNFYGPGMRHVNPALDERAGQVPVEHGYDVRTGKELWSFHTLPEPGQVGYDTWPEGAAQNRTGNNVWAFSLTMDPERGILYLPVSGPGGNFYGGDREGMNLFGNTTVALDANTGKLLWYFQNVHHELWDYNLPPAPSLIDITMDDGEVIPALAQVGKSGFMYILNRVTGEPVFGVEERVVATSNVPGEHSYPTQPIPLKPPPIARVAMTRDDLVRPEDTTPEHAAACLAAWDESGLYNQGPFTPWPDGTAPDAKPAIVFPGVTGGVNWGGTSVDPELGYIFVNSKDAPAIGWMIKNEKYTEGDLDQLPYIRAAPRGVSINQPVRDAEGNTIATWPCFRPPWGRLIAVDAKTGDFAWEVPLGITESMPEGKQNTGTSNSAGSMVTAGKLVFIGATGDKRFRAFDSRTGDMVWETTLPYTATANPMTYSVNGKQYVAITAASGGGFGASAAGDQGIYVFALPE